MQCLNFSFKKKIKYDCLDLPLFSPFLTLFQKLLYVSDCIFLFSILFFCRVFRLFTVGFPVTSLAALPLP